MDDGAEKTEKSLQYLTKRSTLHDHVCHATKLRQKTRNYPSIHSGVTVPARSSTSVVVTSIISAIFFLY